MKYETLDGEDAPRNSGCGTGRRLKVVWIAQMMKLDDKRAVRVTGKGEGVRRDCVVGSCRQLTATRITRHTITRISESKLLKLPVTSGSVVVRMSYCINTVKA